jgi:glycosyltransferase involved in cell wall biosynthesis
MVIKVANQRVAVISSFGPSLVNFRFELLQRMVGNGHEVLALAPGIDTKTGKALEDIGVAHQEISMARTGVNPLADLRTVRALTAALRDFRADVILPYTMKPIIYGNMAARRAGTARRYALFTGLGYTFSEEKPTGKRAIVRAIAIRLYRSALQGLDLGFVYNSVEEADIRRFRLVPEDVPLLRVPGSGVNLVRYEDSAMPDGPIRFLMIARLLKSKGIDIYVEAARLLKQRGIAAEVQLLGPLDTNPDAYTAVDLERWQSEKILTYLGATSDVRPFIRNASVIVLPAIHREGVPRTLLEGMSMGRAVITTDVPGCAHTIVHGEDGLIVPAGDSRALADAMTRLVTDPKLAATMGRSGRKRAEAVYNIHRVNKLLLQSMRLEDVGR